VILTAFPQKDKPALQRNCRRGDRGYLGCGCSERRARVQRTGEIASQHSRRYPAAVPANSTDPDARRRLPLWARAFLCLALPLTIVLGPFVIMELRPESEFQLGSNPDNFATFGVGIKRESFERDTFRMALGPARVFWTRYRSQPRDGCGVGIDSNGLSLSGERGGREVFIHLFFRKNRYFRGPFSRDYT
jgi:hypothetical protein